MVGELLICISTKRAAAVIGECLKLSTRLTLPRRKGQYLYNAILRSYDDPEFIGDELFTTIPCRERSERVPGVTEFGDDVEAVNEGKPYPSGSVTETWIQTPDTIKRGLSCDITKEWCFSIRLV